VRILLISIISALLARTPLESVSVSALMLDVANQNGHIHRHQTGTENNVTPSSSTTRRDFARASSLLLVPTVAAAISVPSIPANALLEECGKKSRNCIRTTWRAPPSVIDVSSAANVVREVLNSYPQEGQAGADCNGWRVVKDDAFVSSESGGTIALEYKSCIGPAAVAINLGRPFIDDLKLETGTSSSPSGGILVEVRSSSRMGSSDLFVNRKRLAYLGNRLKERGWSVPEPRYVYEK
jgi:hypothetical protein